MNINAAFPTLAISLLLFTQQFVSAQSVGTPDPYFGNKGKEWVELGQVEQTNPVMCLQPDQKIILAGAAEQDTLKGLSVVRLLPNGLLDPSFGEQGKTFIPLEGEVVDAQVQPDGKILLAGYEFNGKNDDFVVLRLTATGEADPEFNAIGKKRIHLEGAEQAEALTLQSDGRILIAGHTYDESWSDRNIAVVRLNADGSADATFGYRGRKTVDIAKYDHASDILVAETGEIVVAGYARIGTFKEFIAVRFVANGALDPSFGEGGIVSKHIGKEHDHCTSVAFGADRGILLAGHTKSGGTSRDFDFAILALDQNGKVDPSFGKAGIQIIDAGGVDYAAKVLVQPDGQILLVGSSSGEFAVARLSNTGHLDKAFAKAGISRIDMAGERPDFVRSAALQKDGKLVIAGGVGEQVAIARLEGNPNMPGLEEVLGFEWNAEQTPPSEYGHLSVLRGLAVQAWLPKKEMAQSESVARRGTKSLIPVQAAIRDHAHFAWGSAYKVTMVWDLRGGIHYYLDGIYKKTD